MMQITISNQQLDWLQYTRSFNGLNLAGLNGKGCKDKK